MNKKTLWIVLFILIAAGVVLFIAKSEPQKNNDQTPPLTGSVDLSIPTVLYGDKSSCMTSYINSLSEFDAFGLTSHETGSSMLIDDSNITDSQPFPGEVTISFPEEFTDTEHSLRFRPTTGVYSADYLYAGTAKNLYNIIALDNYPQERSGLQQNLSSVAYFDSHELFYFNQYISTPPNGTGVTSCLVRTSNDKCTYMYVGMKDDVNGLQYSLSCYIHGKETIYSIISNAVKSPSPAYTGSVEQQKIINDLAVWMINRIEVLK